MNQIKILTPEGKVKKTVSEEEATSAYWDKIKEDSGIPKSTAHLSVNNEVYKHIHSQGFDLYEEQLIFRGKDETRIN